MENLYIVVFIAAEKAILVVTQDTVGGPNVTDNNDVHGDVIRLSNLHDV